ncbi:Delta-1-pyrroline-5-carboxylate dehydrogenase [Leucoagaricus sp. SymC.cos]|nr:Delta-1-pyrroline-5-carboxylate dehydrogenase [Leucoagaricus sp. SymC.cos]
MATPQLATFKIPPINNEPMRSYEPGSPERAALKAALDEMQAQLPFEVPCIVNGEEIRTNNVQKQPLPHDHARHLCTFHEGTPEIVAKAVEGALKAKSVWENLPWNDRAAIFLKAADLASGKYRYKLMAATMLGQGKNVWQAEIDAAAELSDFFRFGVQYVEELYAQQPPKNSPGAWNRVEYRPLEGFVLAVSPFNFTAIGGNLPGVPALVGNVVVWKPAPAATYSNYIVFKILTEAGVPPGVIQFVPGGPEVVQAAIKNPNFASLHFTGSTHVFKSLWKDIVSNLDSYKGYPRIVGETGGKNWHIIHKSAEIKNAVLQSVRGAFEYQGQKCSALSRLYVTKSAWENGFKAQFLEEITKIKVGPCTEWDNFIGPVIGRPDNSKGFFIQPTVILTKDPRSVTMREEIFGPVVTVYVFEDNDYDKTLELIDTTSIYALTGAIFAQDRVTLLNTTNRLRNAAGNIYYNENARSIKENFVGLEDFQYPSNLL